jgi:hypothetical protein
MVRRSSVGSASAWLRQARPSSILGSAPRGGISLWAEKRWRYKKMGLGKLWRMKEWMIALYEWVLKIINVECFHRLRIHWGRIGTYSKQEMREEWILLRKNENVCLGWGRIGNTGKCQIGMREELLLLRKNSREESKYVSQDKKWLRSSYCYWGKMGTLWEIAQPSIKMSGN